MLGIDRRTTRIVSGYKAGRNPITVPLDESAYGSTSDPQNIVDEMNDDELAGNPWGGPATVGSGAANGRR